MLIFEAVLWYSAADPKMESKEDQWMGVTVQSQGPGGNVVVSLKD